MIVSDERVARYVSGRLGASFCPPYSCLGLERDGEIVAGVIVNHFEGHDCHVSLAGSGWTRAFIKAVGEYVFEQLGCARMTAVTNQPQVVQYAQRLGGKVEGVMRDHFGEGRDATIVGLLRREWIYNKVPANPRG